MEDRGWKSLIFDLPSSAASLVHVVPGVIGAADKRPRLDVAKAELVRCRFEFLELIRV
jgi:hypothetical protein